MKITTAPNLTQTKALDRDVDAYNYKTGQTETRFPINHTKH